MCGYDFELFNDFKDTSTLQSRQHCGNHSFDKWSGF